jgi:hypothetical protein
MKRQPLWILLAVTLYAGCVARPPAEERAVVTRVFHERAANVSCKLPYMSYCEVDVDGLRYCKCVDRSSVVR